MAPLFYFLFLGIFLGLMMGIYRHEDGFGFFSDIELGLLGSILGGMTLVLATGDMSFRLAVLAIPAATALLLMLLMSRVSGNKRKFSRTKIFFY